MQQLSRIYRLGVILVLGIVTHCSHDFSVIVPPCSQHRDCASCTAASNCGWCANEAVCAEGTTSGATNFTAGACSVWRYDASQCGPTRDAGAPPADAGGPPADATRADTGSTACSPYLDCFACASAAACGWCASSSQCLVGDSTGPTVGGCASWSYVTSQCSTRDSGTSDTGGGSCGSPASSGTCATTGQLYCGSGSCCSASSPYFCGVTNRCYPDQAGAMAACRGSACITCVTPTTGNNCVAGTSGPGCCPNTLALSDGERCSYFCNCNSSIGTQNACVSGICGARRGYPCGVQSFAPNPIPCFQGTCTDCGSCAAGHICQ